MNKYKKIKRTISVQLETPHHNTICGTCDSNCHEKCGLEETSAKGSDIFKQCSAMDEDGKCKHCKHSYTHHVHLRAKWVKNEEEKDMLDPKQQKLIELAAADIAKKGELKQSLTESIKKCEEEITAQKGKIQTLITQLRTICSNFNYVKEIDLNIEMLKEHIEWQQQRNMGGVVAANVILEELENLKKVLSQSEL